MPELPDVETCKRYIDTTSLYQKIRSVKVYDRRILRDTSPDKLHRTLVDNYLRSTYRVGKYLFVKTDSPQADWLVLHFGMTGFVRYFKDKRKIGPHDRLIIVFSNGFNLAYVCQRLLGRVRMVSSVESFIHESRLGPDALRVDLYDFERILMRSKANIKSTLMNQKRIAGIGNIYSDEILFQSNVHPQTQSSSLNHKQIEKVYSNMRKVLQRAIERHGLPHQLPPSYLLPHRQKGQSCPRCDSVFMTIKVSGRTAYFCPNCQK